MKSMPKIKEEKVFIYHGGKVFQFPLNLLKYYRQQPDILEARVERALEKGMWLMDSTGRYGCGHCGHWEYKQYELSVCGYEGNPNIKIATPAMHKPTGKVFIVQQNPCVVEDAFISVMYEKGLLNRWEVDRLFDFPARKELQELLELDRFELKKGCGGYIERTGGHPQHPV